ncbi:proline--tRNA ligase [Patescibacteria group bacterium]|nr:proline--tRNA ligase [Patescibacteria group bacterium]MBU1563628.1 proline--tRNA ligase [Patescibacteria group bacterium]MBU2068530.1 proline--tRNA ligase [Patescibacteria group bacterium]
MRQSQIFAKTKKEAPKRAETVSHKYLIRGDFIDQLAAGIYTFLPLGWRVHSKIENIIREEMNKLGGQELLMPTLIPQNLWQETKRWDEIDPPLFIVRDRHEKKFGLGSTHEEVITDLIRKRVSSYQDLPLYLYQIQNKFRNEIRATGGLLRVREFIMKDLYSFDSSEKDSIAFYEKVKITYLNIFKRTGLDVVAVEANSGTIGGDLSHEFILFAETGEDKIFFCSKCGFGANFEKVGDIKDCPECKGVLEEKNGIEVGHIFHLGIKYSQAMKAEFVDKNSKRKPIVMGCYGIGLGRLLAAIVEASHDEQGIIWPESVAPFKVHLINLMNNKKEADGIYKKMIENKIEVLYDDRDKTPGEKFAEADLIGIPYRIVVSQKTLDKDSVEIKKRNSDKLELVKIDKIVNEF